VYLNGSVSDSLDEFLNLIERKARKRSQAMTEKEEGKNQQILGDFNGRS